MKILFVSTYHIIIVSLYILFCIYIFIFNDLPQNLFAFNSGDITILLLLLLLSVGVFFIANYFLRFGSICLQRTNLARLPIIFLYAFLLIAIPEEILFRGLIQTYFYSLSSHVLIAIVASSAVFGFAHILNDAKGFSPVKWNWKLVIVTFLAGIFLGIGFYITESLVVSILLHTIFIMLMKVGITVEK